MAIQVSGTEVISNARALNNIASVDATTKASIEAAGVGGIAIAASAPTITTSYGQVYYNSTNYRLYVTFAGAWKEAYSTQPVPFGAPYLWDISSPLEMIPTFNGTSQDTTWKLGYSDGDFGGEYSGTQGYGVWGNNSLLSRTGYPFRGIFQLAIPQTGTYTITLKGAKGPNWGSTGGSGAIVTKTGISFSEGDVISVLIGFLSNSAGGVGGGGSFVWQSSSLGSATIPTQPLLVAGAGGGGSNYGSRYGSDAGTNSDGSANNTYTGNSAGAQASDTIGNGGAGQGKAGGGAGWNSNGGTNPNTSSGSVSVALSPRNGGTGGTSSTPFGGFGGGGAAYSGGAGGGGYTGGKGGQDDGVTYMGGGGGGSYGFTTATTGNQGHGSFKLEKTA